MSNKKLVFKLDIEHPDYEALSELSASVRNGCDKRSGLKRKGNRFFLS